MSERITRKMVERTFEHFVKYMEFPTKGADNKPYMALDHYNPGGNKYQWKIVIVRPERGYSEEDVFGYGRMTAETIYHCMHFAMNVKQYQERQQA